MRVNEKMHMIIKLLIIADRVAGIVIFRDLNGLNVEYCWVVTVNFEFYRNLFNV